MIRLFRRWGSGITYYAQGCRRPAACSFGATAARGCHLRNLDRSHGWGAGKLS